MKALPILLIATVVSPLLAGIRAGSDYPLTNADFAAGLTGWSQQTGSGAKPFEASAGPGGGLTTVEADVAAGDYGNLVCTQSLAALGIESPTATELGQKLELGGFVYLPASSQFTPGGSVFLQLHSVRGGVSTRIAQSDVLDIENAPRDRWLYLHTKPVAGHDARILSDADELRVTVKVLTSGILYFDDLVLGKFDYSEYPLDNRSFEQGADRPVTTAEIPSWKVVSGSAVLNQPATEPDAYYGSRYLKLQGDGLTKVRQILWLDEGATPPRWSQRTEAGAWIYVEEDLDLQAGKFLKLEVFAGAKIASVQYKPVAADVGRWTFLHTAVESSARIPVGAEHLRIEFTKQMAGTVRLDFVQAGELHGINGNPKKHVACNYLGNYRNLLHTERDLFPPPSCPTQAWRNWYSENRPYSDTTEDSFQHNPDATQAPVPCSAPRPDGFRAPWNLKRDVAISPARNAEHVPLAGAYDSRDEDIVRYHVRLAKAIGIDSFVFDYYGSAVRDQAIQNGIEPVRSETFAQLVSTAEEFDFKVAVMYEPKVHFLGWVPHPNFEARKQAIRDDLLHLVDAYYDRKAMLKHDGRLVVYLFGHRQCEAATGRCLENSDWRDIRESVRQQSKGGRELFLIGGWIPDDLDYKNPDAWYPDLDGTMKWDLVDLEIMEYRSYERLVKDLPSSPPIHALENYAATLNRTVTQWARRDDSARMAVPVVWPGFDDRGVAGWGQPNFLGENGLPISVRVASEFGGEFLRSTFDSAQQVDSDWLHLVTWNDWNESTAIEPRWRRNYVTAVYNGQTPPTELREDVYRHALEAQRQAATFKRLKYGKQLRPEMIYATAENYLLEAHFDPEVIAYD